ncbi:MAG: hypothetical protein PHF99_03100 [Bacteroidales bacterium]|nr:hypothetical protein [Bacteroidales bacterium]
MEDNEKLISFYKELYYNEHARRMSYDKIIQYPATLVIIFIGCAYFLLNDYYPEGVFVLETIFDYLFLIFIFVFLITIILSIWYLVLVFHSFTRKYEYLPYTSDLHKHEKTLFRHHYKFSDKVSYTEKRNDAHMSCCNDFSKIMKAYYIELTDYNQKINDKRADYYAKARMFIFFSLIALFIIGIINFLNF